MRWFALCLAALLWVPAYAALPDLDSLTQVPRHLVPPVAAQQAVAEHKGRPLSIGVGVPLELGDDDGIWDRPDATLARWRLRVASPGAEHLSLRLDRLELPAGGKLQLYSADGRDVQGPFGPAEGPLTLPVVRSAEVVLEATMPAAARDGFALGISHAVHGFRRLSPLPAPKGQIGDAEGTCHIDVACPEADPWRQDVQSAILVTRLDLALSPTPVQYICSGFAVNNVRQDDRPLVMTAAHCGITELTRMNDVHVYFNVHKPSCGSTRDGPVNQVIPGGRFLARDSRSDYTLFELSARPPVSYNVFLAGWDVRTTVVPQAGVGIHHPGGDDKKISFFTNGARRVDNAVILTGTESIAVDVWRVQWSRGVTEPGSSGSGLWNEDHRVIGVLSGGRSACDDPTGPDLYGRLDRAWTAGLREHLDPDNTGAEVFNGKRLGSGASTVPMPTDPPPAGGGGGGGGGGGALDVLGLLGLVPLALRRRRLHSRA